MLFQSNIPIYTTKTGDVVIWQHEGQRLAKIANLNANNSAVSSSNEFVPKRFIHNL